MPCKIVYSAHRGPARKEAHRVIEGDIVAVFPDGKPFGRLELNGNLRPMRIIDAQARALSYLTRPWNRVPKLTWTASNGAGGKLRCTLQGAAERQSDGRGGLDNTELLDFLKKWGVSRATTNVRNRLVFTFDPEAIGRTIEELRDFIEHVGNVTEQIHRYHLDLLALPDPIPVYVPAKLNMDRADHRKLARLAEPGSAFTMHEVTKDQLEAAVIDLRESTDRRAGRPD